MDRKLKVVVMSCVAIVAAIGAWALPTSAFAAVCPGGPGPTCIELRLNNPPTYGGLWVRSGRDTGAMAGLRWINDLENVAFEAPAGKLFTSVSIELECQGPGTRLHDVQVYYYLAPGQLCEQQLIEPPLYAAKPHGAPGVNSYILDTVPSDVLCAAGFKRIEIEPQIGSACNIVTTAAFRTASSALADSASTGPNMTEAPRENTPTFSDGATVQTWPTPGVPGCLPDVTPNWPGALINVDSTAPVAPPIQLCFNNLVQPTCFATPDNGATVFSSADAHAVQQAVDAASSGGTVKIAGTCPGVESRAGASQSAHISKTLTLLGGFTSTAWTTTYPLTQPTILDAGGAGRVLYATQNLTVANLTAQNGSVAGFGGGIMAASALLLQNVSVYSSTAMIADGGGVFATGNGSVFGGVFRANKCTSGCSGGGISSGGALIVSGTSFISNTGGHNGGGLHNNYALTLTNSSFSDNLAANGDGGGVANFGPIPIVISGSTFAANRATNTGGGAYFVGSVNVSASAFSSNTASSGGGAYFVGNVNVSNSAFSSNTSSSAGGGALFNGSVTLSNSAFNSNTASSAGGGALFNGNAPTVVTGASFVGNVAPSGGGAYFLWAATVTDSLFMSNTAISGGGAWFDDNNNITASSFLGNKASDGGGAYFNFIQPKRLVNTLFARNSASNRGAAIFVADATPLSLIHTTIASPTLALGAAVYVAAGTVLLTDTLISSHAVGIQRSGGAVSEDYTLFDSVTMPYSGTVSAGAHSMMGTAAFVNPAADNYRLGPGSAAINTGVNTGVAVDFEGQPRPIGAGFDIGYDEHIPPRAWLPAVLR